MIDLKSIEEEAKDCRAAWPAQPHATVGLHIHHEIVAEALTEPIEHRIAYILSNKPKEEQALRLRLMRPIRAPASAEYERVTAAAAAEVHAHCIPNRSEERRVGKEGRSRWSPYH